MANNIISRMRVVLGLDNSKFKSGLKDSEKRTKSFGKTIGKIGGLIAGAFAVGKIVSFFKTSFKLYGIQEKAEQTLRAQIEANGKAAESTLDEYKKFASGLQNITTVGDETTLGLLQVAESMGATTDESKAAAKGAIGLSKAFGISLETAMRGVILANEGQFEMLQRYIPKLRTANTDVEKAAILQKAMADGMKIATAEASTSIGKIEQLSNTWGDLQESIGKAIAESNGFKDLLQGMTVVLNNVGKTAGNITFDSLSKGIALEVAKGGDELKLLQLAAQNTSKELKKLEEEGVPMVFGIPVSFDQARKQRKAIQKERDILFLANKRIGEIETQNETSELVKRFDINNKSIDELKKLQQSFSSFTFGERKRQADLLLPLIESQLNARLDADGKEIRSIKVIAEELKNLKIDQQDATGSRLININQEIAALNNEITTLKKLGLEIDKNATKSGISGKITGLDSKAVSQGVGLPSLEIPATISAEGTVGASEQLESLLISDKVAADQEEVRNQLLMTQNSMSAYGSVMGSVGQIASVMGESTIATFANVASQVISSVASMIPVLFGQSIAGTVANGALAPWFIAPAVIAAGIAGVVSAFAGIGGGSASSGGGASVTSIDTRQFQTPTLNNASRNIATTQPQPIELEGEFVLKATDMALLVKKGNKLNER